MTAKREQPGPPGSSPPSAASPASAEQQEEQQLERDIGELLTDVERERDEYLELARRTKADFENYRKRVAGEASQAEKRGRAQLIRQLLPVLDNLERALESDDQASSDSVIEGVRLVTDELKAVLERSGVESYEPSGEQFNPDWHEAMMTRATPSEQAGRVLEVLEKGYRLDGQVLRPARVVVGKETELDPSEKGPSAGKPAEGFEAG